MGYFALIGVICFGGLLFLFNHFEKESNKAKETGISSDTSNDGCMNKLFIILLVYNVPLSLDRSKSILSQFCV